MSINFKKIIASTLAIVTVVGTLAVSAGSAEAKPWGKFGGGGFGWGAAGLVGGLMIGSAIAANQGYGYGGGCGYVRQRVYSPDGYFMGWRRVPAC